jgi:hypothetical protein
MTKDQESRKWRSVGWYKRSIRQTEYAGELCVWNAAPRPHLCRCGGGGWCGWDGAVWLGPLGCGWQGFRDETSTLNMMTTTVNSRLLDLRPENQVLP